MNIQSMDAMFSMGQNATDIPNKLKALLNGDEVKEIGGDKTSKEFMKRVSEGLYE